MRIKSVILFLASFLLFANLGYSQATKKTLFSNCILETGKPKPIYIGINNELNIGVSGYQFRQISVKANNIQLKKAGNVFIIKPIKAGKIALEVFANGKLMAAYSLVSKRLPTPIAVIGKNRRNHKGGIMGISTLCGIRKISCIIDGTQEFEYKIISFEMEFTERGMTENFRSKSNKLTTTQVDAIRKIPKGKKVIFHKIKAKAPDGSIRDLGSLVFKLR